MDPAMSFQWPHKDMKAWGALSIMGFLGIMFANYMRVDFNVAFVALVKHPPDLDANGKPMSYVACPNLIYINPSNSSRNVTHIAPHQPPGELDRAPYIQALYLGSFYYGYILLPIPISLLSFEAIRFKWLFGSCIFFAGLLNFLVLLVTKTNGWILIVIRFLQGFTLGAASPAMNVLIHKWFPDSLKAFHSNFIFSGVPAGIITGFGVTGLISNSQFVGGWRTAYYISGGLAIIWFGFWAALVYESPETHLFIGKVERRKIILQKEKEYKKMAPLPWKCMWQSRYVWALTITHFGSDFGHYTLLIEMPSYFANVLHLNISENGLLCSIPYLLNAFAASISILLSDKLQKATNLSRTDCRKVMNSLALFLPAAFLLIIPFLGCRPLPIYLFLTLAITTHGLKYSGYRMTYRDLCPDYSNKLLTISCCITNTTGLFTPLLTGWFTESGASLMNWTRVFITAAAGFIIAGSIFIAFGSAEEQPWGRNSEIKLNRLIEDSDGPNLGKKIQKSQGHLELTAKSRYTVERKDSEMILGRDKGVVENGKE